MKFGLSVAGLRHPLANPLASPVQGIAGHLEPFDLIPLRDTRTRPRSPAGESGRANAGGRGPAPQGWRCRVGLRPLWHGSACLRGSRGRHACSYWTCRPAILESRYAGYGRQPRPAADLRGHVARSVCTVSVTPYPPWRPDAPATARWPRAASGPAPRAGAARSGTRPRGCRPRRAPGARSAPSSSPCTG